MTQQIHDAAPDMKCRRSVLVPKCAAQSPQKAILTAQKSYLTVSLHCVASLHLCNCSHSLFYFVPQEFNSKAGSTKALRYRSGQIQSYMGRDHPWAILFFWFDRDRSIFGFFIRYWSKLIDIFGLSNKLFLGDFLDNLFFRIFFDELFLNKRGGRGSGVPRLPKMCVFLP